MMSIIQIQSECINTGFIVFYLPLLAQIVNLLRQIAANTVIKKKIKKRIN